MKNIVKESEKKNLENIIRKKKCSKCKKIKNIKKFTFSKKKNIYYSWCHKCTSIASKLSILKNPKLYKDYSRNYHKQNIFNTIRKNMKASSKKKGFKKILFNTTYLKYLWKKQKGICYWSGMKMDLNHGMRMNPKMVSPDRLNPSKGYIKGNIVLCCVWSNMARMRTPVDKWKLFLNELNIKGLWK